MSTRTIAGAAALPVLAIGGAKSFGANEALVMRNAATDVTEVVIPEAGHRLMVDAPAATMAGCVLPASTTCRAVVGTMKACHGWTSPMNPGICVHTAYPSTDQTVAIQLTPGGKP
jgi:hypothetical protein